MGCGKSHAELIHYKLWRWLQYFLWLLQNLKSFVLVDCYSSSETRHHSTSCQSIRGLGEGQRHIQLIHRHKLAISPISWGYYFEGSCGSWVRKQGPTMRHQAWVKTVIQGEGMGQQTLSGGWVVVPVYARTWIVCIWGGFVKIWCSCLLVENWTWIWRKNAYWPRYFFPCRLGLQFFPDESRNRFGMSIFE